MDTNIEVLIESFKQTHPTIKNNKCDNVFDALQYLSQLESNIESDSITEQSNNKFYARQALSKIKESVIEENTFTWPYTVAPYFTPEESARFKGYYSESTYTFGDNNISHDVEILKSELRKTTDPYEIGRIKAEIDNLSKYSGEAENFYEIANIKFEPSSWNKKVTQLMNQLKIEENPEQIDRIKQSLINLGWNPEVDYTVENQIKAKKRIESIYQERCKNIFMLDLTSLVEASNVNEEIISEGFNDAVKPIHIVIVKGDSRFSNIITKATNSQFSHSAICIDNNFNNLYSFNLINGHNFNGGFSIEKIDEYPKDNRLAVFTFFVSKNNYDKIIERVKMLSDNIEKTAYSVLNILTIPFKNINLNLSNSMICSQFVDSILKMANIDITGKDSSHVTPADFYKNATANGKIYKVFDGITRDFNSKKIISYINKMRKKVTPVNEGLSNIYTDFIHPTIMEAKLPIQFNKDGDVLITNPFVDFDREYSASHKLLLHYVKVNNIEAIKYELARLYYMNYILERNLYHNKSLSNKEKNIKTRARVLNDFNKYIKFVLDKESDFNFSEYYEKSIFYPHTIEVKKHTILKLADIIKHIIK